MQEAISEIVIVFNRKLYPLKRKAFKKKNSINIECLVLVIMLFLACLVTNGCVKQNPLENMPYVLTDLSQPDVPHLENHETGYASFDNNYGLSLLGTGWRDIEQDKQLILHKNGIVWAGSLVADLQVFVLEPHERTLVLEMQQLPVADNARVKLQPQQVIVEWNGICLGICEFKKEDEWDFRKFSFDVPENIQDKGRNVIAFHSRVAVSPAELYGEGRDMRSHAFGLKSLCLDPATSITQPPAVMFTNDAIVQPYRSKITFPVRLPENGNCKFVMDNVINDAGVPCSVTVKGDSLEGPSEYASFHFLKSQPKEKQIVFDLSTHEGEIVEVAFQVGSGQNDGNVSWIRPRIISNAKASVVQASANTTAPVKKYDNVVLIVLDALRADHVDAYGYYRDTTPCMDKLAGEGSLAMRAYAAIPYTYCSTQCLFVGQYPFQHGSTGYGDLVPSSQNIGECLKKNGVATGMVSANPLAFRKTGMDESLEAYEPLDEKPEGDPSLVTNKALDFMCNHQNKRFFLYLHYRQPHAPYRAPAPYSKRFSEDPTNCLAALDENWDKDALQNKLVLTPRQRNEIMSRYDENILTVDAEVGNIAEALRSLGIDKNTLLIITADHGEGFGEHENCYMHSVTVYEPLLHIPLLFYGENVREFLPAQFDSVVSSVDIFPTICELMGIIYPNETVAGESVVAKASRKDEEEINAFAQASWFNRGALQLDTDYIGEAYWWSRYKLIRDNNAFRVEVYDIVNDPLEHNNLAPLRPVLTDYLLSIAGTWKNDVKKHPIFPPKNGVEIIDDDNGKQLKALGYL